MLIENLHYDSYPDYFEIRRSGNKAVVLFPTDVEEVTVTYSEPILDEEGEESSEEEVTRTEYIVHKVYVLETTYTNNLEYRINTNFDKWLKLAKTPTPATATIADLEEAINALTEIVLGGDE